MKSQATVLVLVIGLALSACGGDDNPPPAGTAETPSPSSATDGLPPQFIECMARAGYEIESADDIHSAPQQVLQTCFGSLHQGGASP
jgi:hypothetical protein